MTTIYSRNQKDQDTILAHQRHIARIEDIDEKDILKAYSHVILMDSRLSMRSLEILAKRARDKMDHLLERDGKSN